PQRSSDPPPEGASRGRVCRDRSYRPGGDAEIRSTLPAADMGSGALRWDRLALGRGAPPCDPVGDPLEIEPVPPRSGPHDTSAPEGAVSRRARLGPGGTRQQVSDDGRLSRLPPRP